MYAKMGLRALKLNEKVLGPEHPQTLASMNNLAVMLDIQGKDEASEASESSMEMQLQELELELRRIIAGVNVSESRPMERGRTAGRASDGDEQEGA
jgi:Tetratricopeptide repeat